MSSLSKKPPLFFKITVAIISVVLFVAVAEFTLRTIDPELSYKNQMFPLNRDIDFPEFYEKDSRLFWKIRANQKMESRWFSNITYTTNSLGLRGPVIKEKSNAHRILALGNSCTFGWGVMYDDCWTMQLQKLLKETYAKDSYEVINAGIPGYTSYQGKILFKKLLPLKPDRVLIMHGWNDHWRAGRDVSDAEQNPPPQFIFDIQNSLSKLKLYKLLRKMTLSLSEDTTLAQMDDITGKRRVSQKEFSLNLKEIIAMARENNIEPILLVPPIASLENYIGSDMHSNFHLIHKKYQDVIITVGEYENVQVVNLQTQFDKHNDLFSDARNDPIHFNEKGHRVAADEIFGSMSAKSEFADK